MKIIKILVFATGCIFVMALMTPDTPDWITGMFGGFFVGLVTSSLPNKFDS